MSVERIDKSPIETELAISIPKVDYEPKLKSEMRKYQQKAHMKGFRKGKVPMSVIRKMYGKAMLAEVVNDMMVKQLESYLKEQKLEVLGQPIPSEDQETYDFDSMEDFEFKFDVGIAPKFELQGLDKDTIHTQYLVKVTDEMVDEQLQDMRMNLGKEVSIESDFEDTDRVVFEAKELEEEAGSLKKKGFEASFVTLISDIANEDLRNEVKSAKVGDLVRFNIYTLEGERTDEYVRKYLLGITDEEADLEVGAWYEARIDDVKHIQPADLDADFFKKAFGEDVTTEDESRDAIKERIKKFHQVRSDALLFKSLQDRILELNKPDLPDEFLRRWLLLTNEELDVEMLDDSYKQFSQNLIWTLVERAIQEKFDLKVEAEEVREALKAQFLQAMGYYDLADDVLNQYVDRMMSNREQVEKAYTDLISDKVFETIRDQVTLEDEMMDLEDFNKKIEAVEKEVKGRNEDVDEEE